ncbi:MAG: ATP-dependent DNA helicase RecG [Bacteroidales bacterium]|nr:ATP-dependent DNA helicase RecG [Bacteroidales bacterium]
MDALNSDIKFLPGVGPKRAELLKNELGISTFSDLIHLYPFRYIDRSSLQKIIDVRPDLAYVQILARVTRVTLYGPGSSIFWQSGPGAPEPPLAADGKPLRFNAVKRLSVWVADATGEMEMVFFKGIKWNFDRLKPGLAFLFFGKPAAFNGRINIVHPEVDPAPAPGQAQTGIGTLTGVYPSTEKLKNGGITGKVMNRLQAAALSQCLPQVEETLPEYVLQEKGLCGIRYALQNIHFPESQDALAKATFRLKFEELFLLQLSLLKQKYIRSRSDNGIPMSKVGPDFNACYNALPYELTGAQKRVIKEIRSDLKSGRQMNRLLQGDVGSGKTMVAVLSALIAVGNGFQACLMAPTEVLAQQHYANICKYLKPTSVRCALLTGSSTVRERREIHAGLEDGSIGLIVGTHALLEDDVRFKVLGLAIIDEQHRFGVEQRSRLWAKGPKAGNVVLSDHSTSCTPSRGMAGHPLPRTGDAFANEEADEGSTLAPHVLVMTATPIPRTLAMTVYGDLDVSVIDEMPPGRKPVQTLQISQGKRPHLYRFMKAEIDKGRQVFVVYPLIFESEKMDLKNLQTGYEDIVQHFPFPPYKVAIVHGRQTNDEKNFNMDAFAAGRAHILVSTTVIEVGVDVPNASVMVIESAERFGLSQLHQLRGRVGRGAEQSYCILVKDVKVSKESQKRIDLLCSTEDGFELAEADLKMRGPGDLEGTQQSGLPISLNIASLAKDGVLLGEVRRYAEKILQADPALEDPVNASLRKELRKEKYEIRDFSRIS